MRRYFSSNLLFLLTLISSLAVHVSLGWYGRSTTQSPWLDREESGRTSVAIQWVAQAPPIKLPAPDSVEPLVRDRYWATESADASPAELPFPTVRRDVHPKQPLNEGVEPVLATRPPRPRLPNHQGARVPVPPLVEPQPDQRVVPRREPTRVVELEESPVDIPETLVSLDSSGADVPPSFVTRPLPDYPEHLLLQRIEGVVRLVVTVQRDGRVASAEVHATSGYAEMDASALRTVRQWVFTPARRGGVPVQDTVIVPVRFKIRWGG